MICDKCDKPMRWATKQKVADHPGTVPAHSTLRCNKCTLKHGKNNKPKMPETYPCAGTCGRMLRASVARKDDYPDTVAVTKNGKCWSCNNGLETKPGPVYPGSDHVYAPGTSLCAGTCGRLLRLSRLPAADYPGSTPIVREGKCYNCVHRKNRVPTQTTEAGMQAVTAERQTLLNQRAKRAEKEARRRHFEENFVVTRYGVRPKVTA